MVKSTLTVFPYYKNSQGDYYPIIPLVLWHKSKKWDTDALIDSGAAISIFQPTIADSLGVKINSGKEIYLGGIGGRIKGYIHQLKIEISNKTLVAPVVFSYEYHVSVNLLGRDSVFNKFKITFEENRRRVELN